MGTIYTMRGAWLAHCVIQSNKEGGVFLRINARCDYTKEIRDENNWVELPDNSKNMDLIGAFTPGRFNLECQQQGINGVINLELPFTDMTTFRAVRVSDKDQESTRVELRFHIITTDLNAAALCQNYKANAKKTLGVLMVEVATAGEVLKPKKVDPNQPALPGAEQPVNASTLQKIGGRGGKATSKAAQLAAAAKAAGPVLVTSAPDDDASTAAIEASLSATDGQGAVQ